MYYQKTIKCGDPMKKYLKRPDFDSNDLDKIRATVSIEVDPATYDDSNDSDDTVYHFDTLEEFRRWLNADIHCIYKEVVV